MAARLADTARRLGVDPEGLDLLHAAFRLAMAPREERLGEQDPDYLHPARTALILMDDAGVSDPPTLAAAALAETRTLELRSPSEDIIDLDPRLFSMLETLPEGDDPDRLREDLVSADPPVLLIALAERLDHARHLHLRPRGEWAEYHEVTCAAHARAAARAHPRLEQRLTWWCRTFEERFLAGR